MTRLRVIHVSDEGRLRKGKPLLERRSWWLVALDWIALPGLVLSAAIFPLYPVTISSVVESAVWRGVLWGVQAVVFALTVWLFLRGRLHSRVDAQQGYALASNRAFRLGLVLGWVILAILVWGSVFRKA